MTEAAAKLRIFGICGRSGQGKTTLIITHNLNLIRSADCILVVDQGRIMEKGTHDELLATRRIYAEYYGKQGGALGAADEPATAVLAVDSGVPPQLIDDQSALSVNREEHLMDPAHQ